MAARDSLKFNPIRVALLLCVAGILYLTLYPFELAPVPRQALSWDFPHSRSDWMDALINCYFFLPFGFLGGLSFAGRKGIWWTVLGGALLSFTVEHLQLYIPMRDASYRDVLLNTTGAWAGAALSRMGFVQKLRVGERLAGWTPDFQALLLVAIWFAAEWFPFIPALRLHKLPRVFFDGGPWVPVVALAFAGFAVSRMLPLLTGPRYAAWIRFFLVTMIPVQFLLIGRSPRAMEVMGAMVGMAAGFLFLGSGVAMAVGALAALTLRQFTSFHWSTEVLNPFGWVPLAGALSIPPEAGFRVMMEKLFFVTYATWAVRRGFAVSLWVASVGVFGLVLAGEIGQMYQVGRVPEVGDLLVCVVGGLALGLTRNRDRTQKSD